jgi:hypothetical protein
MAVARLPDWRSRGRVDHVGGGLNDLPERVIGAFVVDAANVVRALF